MLIIIMASKVKSLSELIVEKLPKDKLWTNEDDVNYTVMPKINQKYLSKCCADIAPKTNRPMWIIGGIAFYSVYSINFDSTVIMGTGSSPNTNNIPWLNSITMDQLVRIFNLVMSKDPSTITYQEINDIVNS